MSQRLQNSLHKIANEISATEANKQAWLSCATTTRRPPLLIRKKTSALSAALVAVLVLAGFAFVNSVYFNKIFGEPFFMSSPNLSDNDLRKLLVNLSPGDVLNTEIETADGTVVVKAICGDTLDAVAYGYKGDSSIHSNTFPHEPITRKNIEERLETIKGLKVDRSNSLEDRIAAGEFIAGLDSPEYILEYILLKDKKVDSLLYKGKSGETIQVTPVSGQLYMDEKSQENALISDKTIDERIFTVIEHPDESGQVDIYLYIGDNSTINSIALYNFDPRSGATIATKEQMLDAAKHLVLYNEHANLPMTDASKDYYNAVFFQKINDPVIQGASNEIAASIRNAQKDENNPEITVWEKDGRSISVGFSEEELVNSIMLEYKNIEYKQILKMLSLPEQSPFDSETWFPSDNLRSVIINYYEGRLTSVFWYSEDFTSSLNMRPVSDREIGKTPLDTLAMSSIQSIHNDLIKVVKDKDGSPCLVSTISRPDGKTTILVTATKKYGGKTFLYQLRLDESELPGESLDWWIDTF